MILDGRKGLRRSVSDEVQAVLDKAYGTPLIVENSDDLDFEVGGNADRIGPGVSDNDNPEELPDTIDMNYMRVLNIELVGFHALEHRFNGQSFLVGQKGFPVRQKDMRICGSDLRSFLLRNILII